MCIVICWVDSSYAIQEAALGLVQLPDTKALTFGIKDVLVTCSLPITDCVGQAYDGASNEWCAEWCPGSHEESDLCMCMALPTV